MEDTGKVMAADTAATSTIVVDGHEFTINNKRLRSWVAFNHLRNIRSKDTDDYDRIAYMMQLVEYITGRSEDDLVKMCGDEDAALIDVINLVNKLIVAAYPKN